MVTWYKDDKRYGLLLLLWYSTNEVLLLDIIFCMSVSDGSTAKSGVTVDIFVVSVDLWETVYKTVESDTL